MLASLSAEPDFSRGNLRQGLNHKLLLPCSDARFECVKRVPWKDLDLALAHDRAGVVLGIHEVNRHARFCFVRLEYGGKDAIAVHALPAELGQQGGMSIEDSAFE